MTSSIAHVLLTRFNLPTPGVESFIRAKEGWLRDRQILFERYCLPSVLAQTVQEFHWIIYFDTESPEWLKNRIRELSASGEFTPIYRQAVSQGELLSDIEAVVGRRATTLMTTNLDNDDAVASDFVERLQDASVNQRRTALYITHGLIKQYDKLYLRRDLTNAFCSVSEPWQDPVTCWTDWHNRLGLHMPVRQISGTPGWLQVVHENNVSNRVRGRRVSPEGYVPTFGDGLADVEFPRKAQLAIDRYIRGPARSSAEVLRKSGKEMVLRIGGKDGLERIKVALIGGAGPRAQ